jgi:spermidine/putrescine-binding protein
MKKIIALTMLLMLVLTGCGSTPKATLKVYNWGVYIDESLIQEFETENNVRVIYDNFDSNEMMYTQLASGEVYDVVIPSDYTIERMISEDMLQTLDLSIIKNYNNLLDNLKSLPFDENNEYAIPYFWGNVGLVYHKDNVSLADLETQGWNVLANPKYEGRIFIYDSERDTFMVALKALGYSANTTSEIELNDAYAWLQNVNATMSPVYVTDEVIDQMINGTKDLAIMYSGDAVYVEMENENMRYFVPKEGTNIWVDAMVIPKNAKNVAMAHKWIDFMLSDAAALANTEEVAYTTTNKNVFEEVTEADFSAYLDSYVPRLNYEKDENFRYNAQIKKIISDLWIRVKAQ